MARRRTQEAEGNLDGLEGELVDARPGRAPRVWDRVVFRGAPAIVLRAHADQTVDLAVLEDIPSGPISWRRASGIRNGDGGWEWPAF